MARKRPSRHTDDQFALFVERVRDSLQGEEGEKFDEAVSRLLRQASRDADQCPSVDEAEPPSAGSPATILPEPPPFEEIEKAAQDTVEGRNALMLLIGQLVFSWSNNESLLVYVLMVLLGTDEPAAAIVFATLNTTRARLELVRRLMLLKVVDPSVRRELEAVIDRFDEAGRVRNELLRAMYSVSDEGEITHTQAMRFVEKRGRISSCDRHPMDQKRMEELRQVRGQLRLLNRMLWDLLPRLDNSLQGDPVQGLRAKEADVQ